MQEIVFRSAEPPFVWIDVTDPSPEELAALAVEHELNDHAVKDCLQPEHLPKHEKIGARTFVIVRAFDAAAPADADNIQEMTRKVALFIGEDQLLTVHRKSQPYLDRLKLDAPDLLTRHASPAMAATAALLLAVLGTFRRPLEQAENAVDRFEESVFDQHDFTGVIREVYRTKRRATVVRWMMRHTADAVARLKPAQEALLPAFQDLKEEADQLYFVADKLIEDVNQLLNIQLSLAAHRTNDTISVLTVLSVFFLPLTFIVGVYGMNFEYMPEIHRWGRWGYPFAWALMVAVTASIWIWFRKQGWLK